MPWCVVQTKPGRQAWAVSNLAQQGFRTIAPLLREHRGKQVSLRPMFGSYIFLELTCDELGWSAVNNTRGVTRVLANSQGRPSYLPERFISYMLEINGVLDRFEDVLSFNKGDIVELVDGPFKGRQAQVSWTTDKRVAVLLSVLSRQTTVYFEPAVLRLAQKAQPLPVR